MNASDDLGKLLDTARQASRADRISWRDPIAEHGSRAIPEMRRWIGDPELGAFAVRVLEKVAERPADRHAATAALRSSDTAADTPVGRDVAEALARLGHRQSTTTRSTGGRVQPKQWSGYETAPPLEQRFHDAMLDVFRLAGEATRKQRPDGTFIRGYWASYFLRAVRNHGGLTYAHQLLQVEGTTDGFARLTEEGLLELTMEFLVLRPEYASLFSAHERQVAASRLARAGYQP